MSPLTMQPITATWTALLALLFVGLSIWVVVNRVRHKVGFGDGGDTALPLKRAIRVHANFAEYVPLALGATYFAELSGAGALWINALGAALLIARILHAWGLLRHVNVSPGRFLGVNLTWIVLVLAAGLILVHRFA